MESEPTEESDLVEAAPQRTAAGVSVRHGFVLGLIAGIVMVAFTIGARLAWRSFTITELAADWFTAVVPPQLFDWLLNTLSFYAKPSMFAGLVVAQILVGGALGAGYVKLMERWPVRGYLEWLRAPAVAVLLWLVSMITLVPLFGGGFFASDVIGGPKDFLLSSLATYALFGVSIAYLFTRAMSPVTLSDGPTHPARRSFLRQMVEWTAFSVVLVFGTKYFLERGGAQMSPSGVFRRPGVLSTEVTPNEEFYVVSKNIIDPVVETAEWRLEVEGLVGTPFSLTYDELTEMPSREQYVTLECISNEIGGPLISNALWRGVPLRDVLERGGLQGGVHDISFEAWDGYSESITLDRAMGEEVLVAYEMNGEPLPTNHGFPARLLIPGFFGLKSVKWLTKIAPVDFNFRGYWQERGWTDQPTVKTMSKFETPATGAGHPFATVDLGGVAFAGDRGISRVELSFDGGETWQEAEAVSQPLSPYTWVVWTAQFTPVERKPAKLVVRATDGQGEVQTASQSGTLPSGATGHHEIRAEFIKPIA